MLVADVIHSPLPLLSELRDLRVKTHRQPRPVVFAHQAAKSSRIRSSAKHTHNPFRISSFKTQDLKPFRMCSYKKTGVGSLIVNQKPSTDFYPEQPSAARGLSFNATTEASDLLGRDMPFRLAPARFPLLTIHYSLLTSTSPRKVQRALSEVFLAATLCY
jgi:hypothetical protein